MLRLSRIIDQLMWYLALLCFTALEFIVLIHYFSLHYISLLATGDSKGITK